MHTRFTEHHTTIEFYDSHSVHSSPVIGTEVKGVSIGVGEVNISVGDGVKMRRVGDE